MGCVVLGGEEGWLAFSVMSFPFGCKCVCAKSNLQSHVLFFIYLFLLFFHLSSSRPSPYPRFPTGKTISSDVVGIRLRIIPRARISWIQLCRVPISPKLLCGVYLERTCGCTYAAWVGMAGWGDGKHIHPITGIKDNPPVFSNTNSW